MQQRKTEITDNIKYVKDKINDTYSKYNLPQLTTLMAVTKTFPAEDVAIAIDCGLTVLGENRILEAYNKYNEDILKNKTYDLHIIGHLQRNKATQAVSIMSTVQSIDKLETLRVINDKAQKINKSIDYLIEVNTSGESQKSGVAPHLLDKLLDELSNADLTNTRIRGLMTVGPLTEDKCAIEKAFESLKKMFDTYKDGYANFDILSMGMSGDFDIAMKQGSTLIRIGSAIFGHRDYDKK